MMDRTRGWLAPALAVLLGLLGPVSAAYADSPGLDAMQEFKDGKQSQKAVENRFFLKEGRFEISPVVGYVPNNPFAKRYVGGAILGYHFSETVSLQADIQYSPDFGERDLKGLTSVLLDRAYNANSSGTTDFQQPLDKVSLAASFGLAWAPLYGKINLVGETVLNFDFYAFVGAGMVSKNNYIATYDEAADPATGDIVLLTPQQSEVKVAPYIGIGQNYFLNQFMAFKIDLRAAFYVDNAPQYDPNVPVAEQRLYNNFVAGGGLAFFFPNMKRRLYDF
jgi:outer membrane beta-barrel protein